MGIGYVWETQWPTSSELKKKVYPTLDRSWCEFFKIGKKCGQKNPPPGCSLCPKFSPHAGHFSEFFWHHDCPVVKIVYG